MSARPYVSYMVRFWCESSPDPGDVCWRGEVESVQTGQTWRFSCWQEMLRFFQTQMEREIGVRQSVSDLNALVDGECNKESNEMDADEISTVEQLLTQVDAATAATKDAIETCTTRQWETVVADEERTVGVVLHHIAYAYPFIVDWACQLARGEGAPAVSYDDVHALNHQHADAQGNVDAAATLALLKTNSAAAAEKLGRLADADLQISAPFALINGQPISVQQVVQWFLVNHARNHLTAIQNTIGGE